MASLAQRRRSMRWTFALTAFSFALCLWFSAPTYPATWSVRKYQDMFCGHVIPQDSRYDMSSYVQAELAQLQSRILALQTQKQALSKSAQSKRSHSALCGTQSTANNATAPAGDALGRCTSNHCSLSDANAEQSKIDRNNTSFLFIGVLSVAANAGRRAAIRHTWMAAAPTDVAIKFVLYEKEQNVDIMKESRLYQDIIFVPGGNTTDYRSIVFKTFAFVQWVATNVNPNFVVKTDDDAYVSCAALVAALKELCRNPDCRNEGLYFGQEKHNGEVITEIDSKWSNLEYFQLTGLKEYMPYMLGGGYVFSYDVAETLHSMHSVAPLKLMPNEDATFGFWVMGMQLRHIGHPKVRAAAGACCFYSLPEEDARGGAQHFQIRTWQDLCSGWLILHKVETEAQMAYLHFRLHQCSQDNALLQKAQQLVPQSSRPSANRPPKVKPLQVAMVTASEEQFHHWGHSDISPWSADGTLMLSQRVDVSDMQDFLNLKLNMTAVQQQLGFVNFSAGHSVTTEITGWNWTYLATTSATSLQLGSRLQWIGNTTNSIIYNDMCQNATPPSATDTLLDPLTTAGDAPLTTAGDAPLTTPGDAPPTTAGDAPLTTAVDAPRTTAGDAPLHKISASSETAAVVTPDELPASNGVWNERPSANLQNFHACAKVFDLGSAQTTQTLDWPVYSVSPDGQTATSFSFGRLDLATTGPKDLLQKHSKMESIKQHSKDDGLWLVNLTSGQARLLVSLHAIASEIASHLAAGAFLSNPMHCYGHIASAVYNPEGTTIALKYHANHCGLLAAFHGNKTYTMTVSTDGTDLWKVPVDGNANGTVSWAHQGLLMLSEQTGTHLALTGHQAWHLDTSAVLNSTTSACRFHPRNDRFVICEGFEQPRKVYVWDLKTDTATSLGNILEANWPSPSTGRNALHPHFTPDGQYIAFDSTHIWETGIQTYVAGVQHLQATPSSACKLNTSSLPTLKATQHVSAPQLMASMCTDTQSTQQPSETPYTTDAAGNSMHTQPTAEHTPAKSSTTGNQSSPQRLLLVLALRDDTWLKSFIAEVSEPEVWQIHVWQAADALSGYSSNALRETLSSFHSKGGLEPTFYNTAAGTHNGSQTITADGSSLYDVNMAQLAHLLLPQPDPSEGDASDSLAEVIEQHHEDWLAQKAETVHCLLSAAACKQRPMAQAAVRSANTAVTWDVETEDIVVWLAEHARLQDTIIVHMDLGQGREFELLHALLAADMLGMIDHIVMRWHYQLANWHLVLLWEHIFSVLGLQYTSTSFGS